MRRLSRKILLLVALSLAGCESILGVEPTVDGTRAGAGGSSDASIGGSAGASEQDASWYDTTGGMAGTAGTAMSGGSSGTGGTSETGGTSGTGGTAQTGGTAGTGGASGTGGTVPQGGAGGSAGQAGSSGCASAPVGSDCVADSNPCTSDKCDSKGSCVATALPDGDPCEANKKCSQARCCSDLGSVKASPSVANSVSNGTSNSWVALELATGDAPGSWAESVAGPGYAHDLELKGFGLTIPTNHVVVGVLVEIMVCLNNHTGHAQEIWLKAGSSPAKTWTSTIDSCSTCGVDPLPFCGQEDQYGGEWYLDGLSDDPLDYNGDNLVVRFKGQSDSAHIDFYNCRVTIYHAKCPP